MNFKTLFFVMLTFTGAFSGLAQAAGEDRASANPALILPFKNAAALPKERLSPLSSFEESPAYKQYLRRPKSELSKLIFLLDHLKKGSFLILYNNKPYEAMKIMTLVKGYMVINYRKEKAEDWIQAHAYKSRSKGLVMYLQYPDGSRRILRDVLLEELSRLPAQ
jgi:hypothetical protein